MKTLILLLVFCILPLISFAQIITKSIGKIDIENRNHYKAYSNFPVAKIEMPDIKKHIEELKKEDEAQKNKGLFRFGYIIPADIGFENSGNWTESI